MPGWPTTGTGIDMPPSPPSQQGAAEPQAGPQAGSQAGAQTGAGAAQGAAAGDPHERNSMNDGRRQLLPPPMQLLQPGATARLTTAIIRHNARAMGMISDTDQTGQAGGSLACGVVIDATKTLPHVHASG
ncbi:MAG: hypothetical protein K8S94_13805 [Planctomycetia bacterium]|nr:hypothetical protein [Planctomycetia bacterium]